MTTRVDIDAKRLLASFDEVAATDTELCEVPAGEIKKLLRRIIELEQERAAATACEVR